MLLCYLRANLSLSSFDETIFSDIEVGSDARNYITKAHSGGQLIKMELNDRTKQMHAGV